MKKIKLLLLTLVLSLLFCSPVYAKVKITIPKHNSTEQDILINTELTRVIVEDLKIKNGMSEKTAYKRMGKWVAKNFGYLSLQKNIYRGMDSHLLNCEGYANMMLKMCEITNIPCRFVIGWVWKNGRYRLHGWNRVKIGKKWYYSDICWYDSPWYPNYLLSRKLWQRPRHRVKKVVKRVVRYGM